ncbi:LuxR family transcriptional regulator [Streptomyces ochraceiscleroticus]|uniref:LuxR C-terminal-related transcriptional regulator n=1 Tax=Streptomyces ochraceiscleroticus TaxID=47761 RepID=A0ABW1MKK6_9ACTN|nr:LuxR family transcriptional regulator [Streptomyces ochraceiscleroticus]
MGESPDAPLVPRPRLVERLSAGVLGPLTVVIGPPGAGKSALLTQWVHTGTAPGPVARVTCDDAPEPPGLFWARVTRALGAAGVAVPDGDAVPGGERPGPTCDGLATAARLAEVLAARRVPVVLVLDGFRAGAGAPCAAGVAYLLAHAGRALRLVVAARGDPPLHLHRHRLAGDLTELRTGALAFDDRETAELLALHGITLPRRAVASLRERTEGWAAGLRLAALALARQPDPERYAMRFSGTDDAVVGYLVEELLDGQPAEVRRLLLMTSILDRVNAPLAAAVAGDRAGRRFAVVAGEHASLEACGQGWYRYHRMIGEALRRRLLEEHPGQIAALHRRAAAWLGDNGPLSGAVGHALAADDRPYAHRLIVHHLAIGQILGLTATRLPHTATGSASSAVDGSPETALVTAASTLSHGDMTACATVLTQAECLLAGTATPADHATQARLHLTHAVIRTQLERLRDPVAAPAAAAEAQRLFALLPREAQADHPELRALIQLVRGGAELRRGRLTAAESALTTGLRAAGTAGNGALRRDFLVELALLEGLRGRFRAAAELAATAQRPPLPASAPGDPSHAALQMVRAWTGPSHNGTSPAGNGAPPAGDNGAARQPAVALSRRELDVLAQLARTMATDEIAAELQLSVNTVKTHLKSVYRKLSVSRRTAAVRRARELGLLPHLT